MIIVDLDKGFIGGAAKVRDIKEKGLIKACMEDETQNPL
jgi:hypothetical protein